MYVLGIFLAFCALLGWTFGDFSIQRATRVTGSLGSLFFITAFGAIVLLPFVWSEIPTIVLASGDLWLLFLASVIVFFAAMFDFEALKRGKMAIVQPVIGLELPLTVGLSVFLHNERLTAIEYVAAFAVFLGILFAATSDKQRDDRGKLVFERGVLLAGMGAIGLALTNVIVGVSSQQTSPLLTIWCIHVLIALYCLLYLLGTHKLRRLFDVLRRSPRIILAESVCDNAAWICFAYATTMAPIAIVTTVSESYIAFDVLLGVFVNKERLRSRQVVGVCLAIFGLLLLAFSHPA